MGLLGARELVAARYTLDLSPAVRAVLEAYADGLNYYAATHPEQIRGRFEPATGQDIVTGFVLTSPLFFGLDRELMKLFATGAAGNQRVGIERLRDRTLALRRRLHALARQLASTLVRPGGVV